MIKESFVFYQTYLESIEAIKNKNIQLDLLLKILNYGIYHTEPEFNDDILEALFINIKGQIDINQSNREKKSLNGKLGGAPKGNNNACKNKTNKNNLKQAKQTNGMESICNHMEYENNVIENSIMLHPDDVALYQLPLNKVGTYKYIYDTDIKYYEDLYPNVDVKQEFRNMIGWLNSNPTKKKTKNGIDKFINGWLSRKQDNPSNNSNGNNNNKFSAENMMKLVNLER